MHILLVGTLTWRNYVIPFLLYVLKRGVSLTLASCGMVVLLAVTL